MNHPGKSLIRPLRLIRLLRLCFLTAAISAAALSAAAVSTAQPVFAAAALPKYLSGRKILHACGGIGTSTYTNSMEALNLALKKNAAAIEIDFSYTSDGVLVCSHSWSKFGKKAPTYKRFKATPTIGGYTPMTAKEALRKLINANSAYLIPDAKNANVIRVYYGLVAICRTIRNGEQYLKKIVPQIYTKTQYAQIKKVYNFRQWIFTLYKLNMKTLQDYKNIASFCQKNGIRTITMSTTRITKNVTRAIHLKGIVVATHTVNDASIWNTLRKNGADVIYTDFLY